VHVLLWLPGLPSLRVTVVIGMDRRRFRGSLSYQECVYAAVS
jgi:hypothetical protein